MTTITSTRQLATYIRSFMEPWRGSAPSSIPSQPAGWLVALRHEAITQTHPGDIVAAHDALRHGTPMPAGASAREIEVATALLRGFPRERRAWAPYVPPEMPWLAAPPYVLAIVMAGLYIADHPEIAPGLGGFSIPGFGDDSLMMDGGDSIEVDSEPSRREIAIERGRAVARALFPPGPKTRDELQTFSGLASSGFAELARSAAATRRERERQAQPVGELAKHAAGDAPAPSLPTALSKGPRRRIEPTGLSEMRGRLGRVA